MCTLTKRLFLYIITLFFLGMASLQADELLLKNGDVYKGELLRITKKHYRFKLKTGEIINVPIKEVPKLRINKREKPKAKDENNASHPLEKNNFYIGVQLLFYSPIFVDMPNRQGSSKGPMQLTLSAYPKGTGSFTDNLSNTGYLVGYRWGVLRFETSYFPKRDYAQIDSFSKEPTSFAYKDLTLSMLLTNLDYIWQLGKSALFLGGGLVLMDADLSTNQVTSTETKYADKITGSYDRKINFKDTVFFLRLGLIAKLLIPFEARFTLIPANLQGSGNYVDNTNITSPSLGKGTYTFSFPASFAIALKYTF